MPDSNCAHSASISLSSARPAAVSAEYFRGCVASGSSTQRPRIFPSFWSRLRSG